MFAKKAFAFSIANFFSQLITLLQTFVVRWILPPTIMGFWDFANVTKANVLAINLGVLKGAERELPFLRGQGAVDEAQKCRAVALAYSVVEIIAIASIVAAYFIWQRDQIDLWKFYAVLSAVILVILSRGTEAFTIFLQGVQQYLPLSKFLLISTIFSVSALISGAWTGGLRGLFVAAILSEGIKVLWLWHINTQRGVTVGFGWSTEIWKRLVSFGVRFRLTDSPLIFFLMIDIIWVAKFLTIGELAIYAAARNFFIQIPAMTGRIGTVYYTRLLEQIGKGINDENVADELKRLTLFLLLVVIPLMIWLLVSTAPLLINTFIPKYAGSIPILLVLVVASYFSPHSHNIYLLWHAENKLLPHGIANVFALALTAFILTILWFGLGLQTGIHVAYAMLAGYALYFCSVTIAVGRKLWGWRTTMSILVFVLGAAAWTIFVFNFSLFNSTMISINSINELLHGVTVAATGFLYMLPVVAFGLKVSGGSRFLLQMWQKRQLVKI